METKIALVGIIIEDLDASVQVNALLHDVADKVLCRMGFPYRNCGVHLISVIMDATSDDINELADKLNRLNGVFANTMLTNTGDAPDDK